jgi:DNA-binding NtrC family response regulator
MLQMAPARRVLIVDPCDVCHSLLPAMTADGWTVETCTLGAAGDVLCDVGILRLRPFHLEWPKELKALLRGSTAQWIALVDPQVLRTQHVGDFICERFFEFLTLPLDTPMLFKAMTRALGGSFALLPRSAANDSDLAPDCDLIGESRPVRELRRLLGKLAGTESSVLIRGENGTGKERAARRLHLQSSRRDKPFVTFYCAPMAVQTLHRELFGFDKGTFISAPAGVAGRLEQAQGGTLFLDTVEALPLETQARLLACLQEKRFQRVGSQTALDLDIRVLAASAANLEAAVAEGRFHDDLFYRLNVLQVETTPLRERHGDLTMLATHFVRRYSEETGCKARSFSEDALVAMARHQWPGNVRELSNRIRRGIILAEGRYITAADLGLESQGDVRAPIGTLEEYKHRAERQALADVLTLHSDNLSTAAKVLGVSRPTFYRLLHKHQLR